MLASDGRPAGHTYRSIRRGYGSPVHVLVRRHLIVKMCEQIRRRRKMLRQAAPAQRRSAAGQLVASAVERYVLE